MSISALVRLLTVGILCGGIVGCGKPTAQFSGVVVREGQPVSGAEVIIEPEPSGPGSAMALTAADGKCKVDLGGRSGFTPGKYKFTITCYETESGGAVPDGEQGQVLKQSGQAMRKSYVLIEELSVGRNDLTLDLAKAAPVIEEEAMAPTE